MTPEPLSPLDAAFLAAETPAMPMHVLAVTVLAPPPGGLGVRQVRRLVTERLGGQRRLWQRVQRVPFGLDHPVWVDEAATDLGHHVRPAALPAPGGRAELHAFVAELASRPLDPDRPLWELLVVEGLEQGHVALVAKVHHALFDGISGLATLAGLFDTNPGSGTGDGWAAALEVAEDDPGAGGDRTAPSVGPAPAPWDLLAGAARRWARRPLALADAVAGTYLTVRTGPAGGGRAGGHATGRGGAGGDGDAAGRGGQTLPFLVPRAPWNGTVSARRASAVVELALDDLRTVTRAFGGTVNDVLLAAVGGALRRRAAGHPDRPGLRPGAPLVAGVPVSVRRRGQTAAGNRVSAMLVSLATDVESPEARYRAVRGATAAAKRRTAVLPEHAVMGWAELAVPALATRATRLAANLRVFDHVPPPVNVVVSNVPGPAEPLWCAGSRVVDLYPFGPVADGIALNVSAVSYRGTLAVGLIACLDRVPRLDELAHDIADAAGELGKAARAATRDPAG